ncbi:vascular cell adhesion protein 1-like [Symphorus nematophorus]
MGPEGPQPPPVVRSGNITATVQHKPQFISQPPSQIAIKEGDPLQLNCSAVGDPSPSYAWTVPFPRALPSGEILTIDSVSPLDGGQYTCTVSNNMGTLKAKFNVFVQDHNCADKPVFTPSRLVVKHGDPTSARCSVCQHCKTTKFGLEIPLGVKTENGTTLTWTVNNMTEWDPTAICYYNELNTTRQCCTKLPVTVYKLPDSVDFSFRLTAGRLYVLTCKVYNVTPVENLTVTFYRGQTALDTQRISNTEKKPVTQKYDLYIIPTKEDDGGQFWCEAKLDLGPEGPQPPPVVKSGNIAATVQYKPQFISRSPSQITIKEGDPLQLNCVAVGNPSPSYAWTVPFPRALPSGGVLTIDSVSLLDGGQYTCTVSNNMGTLTAKFNVVVQGLKSPSDRLLPATTIHWFILWLPTLHLARNYG